MEVTPPNPSDNKEGNNPNLIKKEDLDKALDNVAKLTKSSSDLAKERDELKARLDKIEKDSKESSGDFKSLAESYKKEADEWKTKFTGLKDSMVINEKHKAASAALVKAGLQADALKLLDKESFEEIQVEVTSQGRFIPHGVDLYVEKFKKEFPFAFGTGTPPTINNGGGNGGPTNSGGEKLTGTELYKLEMECRKKGDMKPYHEALAKFKEQRKQT